MSALNFIGYRRSDAVERAGRLREAGSGSPMLAACAEKDHAAGGGTVRKAPGRKPTRANPPGEPRQVFLFSGHRVDAPGRAQPRFPAAMVPRAAAAIAQALDALDARAGDLALAQGAAGGDLLVAEACEARGVRVQLLLPLPEAEFIAQSVLGCDGDEDWRARYAGLRARLRDAPRVMPDALGAPPALLALPAHGNAVERFNLWLLCSALAHGIDKVRFICLWDGGGGDGPGGTAHMVHEVKRRTGRVTWIDTRRLGGGTQAPMN